MPPYSYRVFPVTAAPKTTLDFHRMWSIALRTGRESQRLWLSATALGLSLHPLGSLPIFIGHHELLGGRDFAPRHARLAESIAQEFHELVPEIAEQTLVMVFRTGGAAAPRIRSFRRPIDQMLGPDSESIF